MEKYISLDALVAEINKRIIDAPINNIGHQRVWAYNDVKDILNTLEVKGVDSNDAFIEKAWNWIEDNMLSSNQQDKSRFYYEQFINYMKGE